MCASGGALRVVHRDAREGCVHGGRHTEVHKSEVHGVQRREASGGAWRKVHRVAWMPPLGGVAASSKVKVNQC